MTRTCTYRSRSDNTLKIKKVFISGSNAKSRGENINPKGGEGNDMSKVAKANFNVGGRQIKSPLPPTPPTK